ncbi:MAG: helix-turn-helix domain-containing protein [Pyrinomonadaceae bacterium]
MKTATANFGQMLKDERKRQRILLKDLADFLRKSVSYLSDVENGRKGAPDLETVSKMEQFLLISDKRLINQASEERWSIPKSIIQQARRRPAVADFLLRASEKTDEEILEFLNSGKRD